MEEKYVIGVFKAEDERDYRDAIKIVLEDGNTLHFMDGEPEDSNIARDFSDVNNIPEFLLKANELGLQGKKIEIKYKNVTWEEF